MTFPIWHKEIQNLLCLETDHFYNIGINVITSNTDLQINKYTLTKSRLQSEVTLPAPLKTNDCPRTKGFYGLFGT